MKRFVALVLVFALLANGAVWGADNDKEKEEKEAVLWGIVGILLLVAVLAPVVGAAISSADEPDNGLRLASFQDPQSGIQSNSGTAIKVLRHIDLEVDADNRAYIGLRFQF